MKNYKETTPAVFFHVITYIRTHFVVNLVRTKNMCIYGSRISTLENLHKDDGMGKMKQVCRSSLNKYSTLRVKVEKKNYINYRDIHYF